MLRYVGQLVSNFAECAQTSVLKVSQRALHLLVLALALGQNTLGPIHHFFAQLVADVLRGPDAHTVVRARVFDERT